jgi:hypothetical protein
MKKLDDEELGRIKKLSDAELKRIKDYIDALGRIKAPDLTFLTATLGQTSPPPDILKPFLGPVSGATPEQAKQQEDQSRFDVQWRRNQSERLLAEGKASKSVSGLATAAQQAGQALEQIIASKIGGGGLGSSIGASVARGGLTDATRGNPGTFANTAVGGAIFGAAASAVGAAIGAGFDAFVKDVFGSNAARERAREALQKAADDFARSLTSAGARLRGDSLTADILDAQQEAADRRTRVPIVGGVLGNKELEKYQQDERNRQLAIINQLEAEQIQLLRERDAEQKRFAKEDLEVRALRASGRNDEANKLALLNQQRQELFEAEKAGYDAAYIARLKEVQAMERTAEAMNALTTSVRNAPSGFKIESYIHQFAEARKMPITYGTQSGWEGDGFPTPKTFGNTSSNVFNVTGPVYIDAKTKTPKKAFEEWSKEFKQLRSSTTGLNDDPAKALNFLD